MVFGDLAKNSVSSHQITDGSIEKTDINLGAVGVWQLDHLSRTTSGVGLIAPGACKTETATGLPVGALTLAMATTSYATAAASAVNGSGAATVTICNHGSAWSNPGYRLSAIR